MRQVSAQRTIQFIDPDVQNLLPDLPDYDTAVKKYPTPPPSYASAMHGLYPVIVDLNSSRGNNNNNAQPLSAQNIVVPTVPLNSASSSPNQASGTLSNPQNV